MKNYALALLFLFVTAFAGAQKLGHCDGQEILSLMPEMKDVQAQLENQAKQLKDHLSSLEATYQSMVTEYQQLEATWPEAIKQSKRQAIINKEQEMAEFEATANKEIADLQQTLLDPLLKKATDAIEAVGKENGFTYIFDLSTGSLLYKGGEDVTPLVKAKMGIQ
ncbi:MAG: OmpH family outer membrane protein [Flavobacteriales bacterium]|nr:OmpH family outer membrane protein [Flavobacteriales bacterium]